LWIGLTQSSCANSMFSIHFWSHGMGRQTFFEERTDQSEVKARIVQKYFYAWAKVIIPSARARNNNIAYIDLYAGPGRYKDGSALSHPLISKVSMPANKTIWQGTGSF